MSEGSSSEKGNWWEFYFVRYFVGTVTGMGLVAFLNFDADSPLQGKILPNLTDISKLDFAHSIVLGAIGLAFCYIASAPILTLHALRGVFTAKWNDPTIKNTYIKVGYAEILTLLVVVGLSLMAVHFFITSFPNKNNPSLAILSLSGVAAIFGLQAFLFIVSLLSEKNYIFEYYKSLATSRAKKKDETNKHSEYIESYKHLREHGNAFFILLMEIIFTLAIYAIENPAHAIIILLLWISPACFVWFLGTYLELSISKL